MHPQQLKGAARRIGHKEDAYPRGYVSTPMRHYAIAPCLCCNATQRNTRQTHERGDATVHGSSLTLAPFNRLGSKPS